MKDKIILSSSHFKVLRDKINNYLNQSLASSQEDHPEKEVLKGIARDLQPICVKLLDLQEGFFEPLQYDTHHDRLKEISNNLKEQTEKLSETYAKLSKPGDFTTANCASLIHIMELQPAVDQAKKAIDTAMSKLEQREEELQRKRKEELQRKREEELQQKIDEEVAKEVKKAEEQARQQQSSSFFSKIRQAITKKRSL